MLFLLVWRNYPRLIHNLLLTFVILFEFVNIFYSNVTFLRTLENFNYPITNTTKLIINIITCPLPLLSYIAAFTNKKLFWGLLMYSVTIFIAFFF